MYDLVDWPDAALRQKVAAAEDAIYHDETDSLANWDEDDLEAALQASGLAVQMTIEKQTEQRRITADHLARWFPAATDGVYRAKASYAQRLRAAGLTNVELERVEGLYGRKLQGQNVTWHSVIVYLLTANRN